MIRALIAMLSAFFRGGAEVAEPEGLDFDDLPYDDTTRPAFGVCRKCSEREAEVVHHAPAGPCPY